MDALELLLPTIIVIILWTQKAYQNEAPRQPRLPRGDIVIVRLVVVLPSQLEEQGLT
jgi:hypothetical protein